MKAIRDGGTAQTLRFLISGGTGFVIYYIIALVLRYLMSWPDGVCATVATLLAVPPAFLMQKYFTFRHEGELGAQLLGYVLLQAGCAVVIGAVAQLSTRHGLSHFVSFFLGGLSGVLVSYVVQSLLIFRGGEAAGERRIDPRYLVARPGSLTARLAARMRRVMYESFIRQFRPGEHDTVLDVGASSDQADETSNYLENWYPHKARVTALGPDDASFLELKHPGMKFVRGNGSVLPFPDGAFDYVHSGAMLEHAGSSVQQIAFIRELHRVARKGVFLTTPNRWFPVEHHSVLPLVHWLPAPWFRAILRMLGHPEFALEENLNLLGPAQVRALCLQAEGSGEPEIELARLFGWPSNIVCVLRK